MARRRRGIRPYPKPKETTDGDSFWNELYLRISEGNVTPIVSDSVRTERIFDIDFDYDLGLDDGEADSHAAELNVQEELAEVWAEEIDYPLPDKHRLDRVAVFNRLNSEDDKQAKRNYLRFLKRCLLGLAEKDEEVSDQVDEIRKELETKSFSEIACQLDYPRFEDECEDALRFLANLPLSIYVTTSYHDFMERALDAATKPYRTQVCFLSGEPRGVAPEHRRDPGLLPTPEEPVVYHLYGFERYPESLVLSEDDYLDFLFKVSEEGRDSINPFIPLRLSEALTESSLILLGYRLHDWDFRVLFRGLIRAKHASLRECSLAIQLDPVEQKGITSDKKAREYLEQYFKPSDFRVEWDTTEGFVKRLCRGYDEWRLRHEPEDG